MSSLPVLGPLIGMNSLVDFFAEIFGGDYPADPLKLHQIAARAAAVYLIGLAIVRLGKSRLIGRVTSLDVLLGFILGSLLSRGITGHASISGTAASSAVIVCVHWLLTLGSCESHFLGRLIKGNAVLLVKDGQQDETAMRNCHISRHDLEEEARLKSVENVEDIRLAYKERNGEVSILKAKKSPHLVEVTVRDGVQMIVIQIETDAERAN
jgi:uncharacterized membrane protein YcaP (DUF421 family)